MPDRRAVDNRPALVYCYDGSFQGFLCCIYDSYTRRERVLEVAPDHAGLLSLYPTRQVETDDAHADRVFASLPRSLGQEGIELLQAAFLAGEEGRETDLFRFVELAYTHGPKACQMLAEPAVCHVHKLFRTVGNEAHHYKGFLRFQQVELPQQGPGIPADDTTAILPFSGQAGRLLPATSGRGWSSYRPEGLLVAVIEPKNRVLPLISRHFCSRYPEEHFIIHDRTHCQALFYRPHQVELLELEVLPQELQGDGLYESMWRGYCQSIAIQSRKNPRCQMTMMPKRFWPHMVEMQGEAGTSGY